MDEDPKEAPSTQRDKGVPPSKREKRDSEMSENEKKPSKVQPIKELMNIKIILKAPEKVTPIGSQLKKATRKEIIKCLHRNTDIFSWSPQDLVGIDHNVIAHHLNIDARMKPVKQKKRHLDLRKTRLSSQK
ncbi:UNVERIFIED_CONTAM: hypothetical protein Sindi_1774900 [Sesamum indicum]